MLHCVGCAGVVVVVHLVAVHTLVAEDVALRAARPPHDKLEALRRGAGIIHGLVLEAVDDARLVEPRVVHNDGVVLNVDPTVVRKSGQVWPHHLDQRI